MKKLLIICGSTAVGKTKLALNLANKFNGELVSADSRQVYKDFNIGTGKDIPEGFAKKLSSIEINNRKIPYYTNGKVKIWGYDIADPNEEFSVLNYKKIAELIIGDIHERNKLPIVVGGTGFYIKALLEPIETISVPQNKSLRKSLSDKQAAELYEILAVEDPIKAGSLNNSDKNNPRRLIRAIEVAKHNKSNASKPISSVHFDEVLKIGLATHKDKLFERIENRVRRRVKTGFEKEFIKLSKMYSLSSMAFSSLGYNQWKEYYKSNITKSAAIEKWIKNEQRYSKKQTTWFKRDKEIVWFKITASKYPKNVEKLVTEWYT